MTSNSLVDVSAFRGIKPAQAFQTLDPNAESLADGIGQSYGIVGYKGKVWTLRLRGNTYQFNRPDDGSPAAFLDVIILRSPTYKSKSYYPAGSFVDGQVGTRPICAALDGANPDIDIAQPQANACAICPRNAFKVNAEGHKTRECSDYKRLAVLILPSQTKPLLGAALMEPVFLRIPAASLNDLAQLGEQMQAMGFHYSSFVTRIGFNPEKPHPQMTFRALQALTDREGPLVLPLREDAQSLRITGENEVGKPRPAQQHAVNNAQAQAQPTTVATSAVNQTQTASNVTQMRPQNQPQQPVQQAQTAQPVDTGFGDPATVTATVNQSQPDTGVLDTGFGDIGGSPTTVVVQPQTVQSQQSTMNTVEDTGPADESDDDIDARVAALMPKIA
jgi:hypothetical protein